MNRNLMHDPLVPPPNRALIPPSPGLRSFDLTRLFELLCGLHILRRCGLPGPSIPEEDAGAVFNVENSGLSLERLAENLNTAAFGVCFDIKPPSASRAGDTL